MAHASLYLGSLYDRLNQCVYNIFPSVGRYDVITYANTAFLQMFLWERFRALSPTPVEFKAFKLQIVVVKGVRKKKL